MKKLILLASALAVVFVFSATLLAPVAPVEAQGIVQCGGTGQTECNICDFVGLIQRLMTFAVYISVLIATGLFAYAGFLLITAAGDTGQVSKAKGIFTSVLIGFIVLLGAYLLVDTIMKAFLKGTDGAVAEFGPWNQILCPQGFQPAAGVVPETPVPGTGGIGTTPGTGGGGGVGTIPGGCSGATCASLANLQGISGCTNGCSTDPGLAGKLSTLGQSVGGITITEACPASRSHVSGCHAACTCVDVRKTSDPAAFISSASSNGLYAVYETNNYSEYQTLVNQGVKPGGTRQGGNVLYLRTCASNSDTNCISAPHYSVYNQ